MPRRIAPKKYAQKSVIYLTFFILFSIPIVVFGLAQDSFDTRNKAFEDLELSDTHQCLISLPSVNPYSLEVGKTVTIQVDARLTDDSISELQIYDSTGGLIYQEAFENSPIEIATSFPFTPSISGIVDMLGIIKKGQGGSVGCEISSPYDIKGLRAVSNNASPEFTSKTSDSKPSQDIKTVDQYEYTLVASDVDGDRINYSYSFTPRADWLKPVIIDDGSNGKLTIKFRGSTDKAASYLANVFIHDGYSTHLRSQSWVISVSPKENDIPVIRFTDPVNSLRKNKGDIFNTSWEANDLNHIIRYELYITNNPANENEWTTINKDIPYNTSSYNVNTSNMNPGTYKLIAKAIDNQDPVAIGMGVSPEIVISQTTAEIKQETDDKVVLNEPQVANMSPSSTEDISNRRVTIRATIIAGVSAEIDGDSIIFKLDDKDITESIKINKITAGEYTLIYQPEEDLDTGVHKAEVSFSDSKELSISKSWNFTIKEGVKTSTETYNIFGYEVAKNIVLIVGIGVLAVILALVAPFIIFSVWKEDKGSTDYDVYKNDKLPPSTPSDQTKYVEEKEISTFREKVDSIPNQEEKGDDAWDMYSVAKPIVTEEQKEEDLEILKEEEPKPISSKIEESEITSPTEEIKTVDSQPEVPEAIQEPEIPEPEIPEAGDLEKIFQQIQQAKTEEPVEIPPVVNQ